jgi:hypothetical protein
MFNQLVLDFAYGLIVLGLINLFHWFTQGIFYPTVDFEQYDLDLIRGILANPIIFLYHFISLSIHALFAGITVAARCWFSTTPVTFLDVVVICIISPSVLFLYFWIKYRYLTSATLSLDIEDMLKTSEFYQQTFRGGICITLAQAAKAYFPGVIILLTGGSIGWFFSKQL